MRRYTFVVQVHPEGISTLENLSTNERVPVSDMATVGLQIELWLRELRTLEPLPVAAEEPEHGGRSPA